MKGKRIYLFIRFERLWHWLQALLIIVLLITGFEIHGTYSLLGYDRAVFIHNFCGITWIVLFFLFVFWLFVTGEWKQYIPTTKKMIDVIRFYSYGIFKGEKHPFHKSREEKHNPLQRIVYLILASIFLPIQILSGIYYYTYHTWPKLGGLAIFSSLNPVAFIHTLFAFIILHFLVIHMYMTTTGDTVFAYIKSMIVGYEQVEETSK